VPLKGEFMFKTFGKYLNQRLKFEKTLLFVVEQGDDEEAITLHRTHIALLEDIIHDFEGFVKVYGKDEDVDNTE
jgi:hypothetical protein